MRYGGGPAWLPERVDFQGEPRPELLETQWLSGVDVRFNQRSLTIHLPPLLLSQPIFNVPNVPLQRARYSRQPSDFFDSLLETIRYQMLAGSPHITDTAKFLGLSSRTLQRRLADQNLAFSKLLEHVRVDTAKTWLCETDQPIGEIANALGYRHGTHFSRAFYRVCGSSPSQYRRLSAN